MCLVLGRHLGCGGEVTTSRGHRYCDRCLRTTITTAIELTADSVPPICRLCRETITEQNAGLWGCPDCCKQCEYRAIRDAVYAAKTRAA